MDGQVAFTGVDCKTDGLQMRESHEQGQPQGQLAATAESHQSVNPSLGDVLQG